MTYKDSQGNIHVISDKMEEVFLRSNNVLTIVCREHPDLLEELIELAISKLRNDEVKIVVTRKTNSFGDYLVTIRKEN